MPHVSRLSRRGYVPKPGVKYLYGNPPSPELADLVKQDVERGAYASIDEYVEQALSMLNEQEAWLAANRFDIRSKIEAGYASAQRGELLEPDEVRQELVNRKRTRSTNP